MDDREARLNQEWQELLEELRVVLPGAEVLFAFLLTVPFTSRFESIAESHRTVYFVAFLSAAVATLLLIAPSAQHRILWRHRAKDEQLRMATWLAIVGSAMTAVAVTTVVYLVTDVIYGRGAPPAIAAGCVGMVTLLWYVPPLVIRLRHADDAGAARPAGRGGAAIGRGDAPAP